MKRRYVLIILSILMLSQLFSCYNDHWTPCDERKDFNEYLLENRTVAIVSEQVVYSIENNLGQIDTLIFERTKMDTLIEVTSECPDGSCNCINEYITSNYRFNQRNSYTIRFNGSIEYGCEQELKLDWFKGTFASRNYHNKNSIRIHPDSGITLLKSNNRILRRVK